jgi:hypothetical protein
MINSKHISGKVSLLTLLAGALVASFFLGKSVTSVSATFCGGWGCPTPPPSTGWGICTSIGPQCGTDNGTQSRTSTSDRGYDWACPVDYSTNPGFYNCRKATTSYEYTDPYIMCSYGYHYQNNGNWNQRCHRDYNWMTPEHTAPIGTMCAYGYEKINDGENTQCRKSVSTYSYADKIKVYRACTVGSVDPNDPSKCKLTETQDCHTGIIDNSACTCADNDADGICNTQDNCPNIVNPAQEDRDNDRVGNACDNCPDTVNPDQLDSNENGVGDACEQSESTPTPEASPTPEATDNGDICHNLDGIQTSVPDGMHLDAGNVNCVNFAVPGEQTGGSTGGQVLGASTVKGQVLGASSMAGTGSFAEALYGVIMGLGGITTAFGFKNLKKTSKLVK